MSSSRLDPAQAAAAAQFDRQSDCYGKSHILADTADVAAGLAGVPVPPGGAGGGGWSAAAARGAATTATPHQTSTAKTGPCARMDIQTAASMIRGVARDQFIVGALSDAAHRSRGRLPSTKFQVPSTKQQIRNLGMRPGGPGAGTQAYQSRRVSGRRASPPGAGLDRSTW
jgi:hypothetical protein